MSIDEIKDLITTVSFHNYNTSEKDVSILLNMTLYQ